MQNRPEMECSAMIISAGDFFEALFRADVAHGLCVYLAIDNGSILEIVQEVSDGSLYQEAITASSLAYTCYGGPMTLWHQLLSQPQVQLATTAIFLR